VIARASPHISQIIQFSQRKEPGGYANYALTVRERDYQAEQPQGELLLRGVPLLVLAR
jgi:hypothetical protein